MKKINYITDEVIYEEKLDNGLKVFLYPTNKTKNFYATVSTFFGAEVTKYKKGNKTYEITKGSAHFLEHRVMDFTKNLEAMKQISDYGSLANAYTTYNGTNYNIFGHENILENLRLLFDRVFKADIKEEDVEAERGIILEEYYMSQSDPYYILEIKTFENAFNELYIKYPVIGTPKGIKTVTAEELNRIYKDFYTPNNMFIVVCGNFNKDEVLNYIKEYTKDIKQDNESPKIIKPKEEAKPQIEYEELTLGLNEPKIGIIYKFETPKKVDKNKYRLAIDFALKETFGKTGEAFNELSKNNIERYTYGLEELDNYNAIYFKASTDKLETFQKLIEKHLKNLKLNKDSLERKKRAFLKPFILTFEDITSVEDIITTDMFYYKKPMYKREEIINSLTVTEANNYLKQIDLNNKSIFILK